MDSADNNNSIDYNDITIIEEEGSSIHQDDELKLLICGTFGFEQAVLDRVLECALDIESLLVITDNDLNDLFPISMLGIRAKFKYHLNLWRRKADTISVSSSCREWIESCTSSTRGSSPVYQTSFFNNANNEDLEKILNESKKGETILNFYKEFQYLDDIQKENLITIIVDSFTNANKAMSMPNIINWTIQIKKLFPNEDIDYYYKKRGRGKNPIGKLHDKAANARVQLRKQTKTTPDIILPKVTHSSNDQIDADACKLKEESFIWLTHNNEPWSEVEKKWTDLVIYRQEDIKSHNSEVLKKWPLLKHSLGYTLIEIDYKVLYPANQSQLFDKWPAFVIKILPYLKDHIKDQTSSNLLQQVNENIEENSRDCLIFLLLHTILKSSYISRLKHNKKINWKPSISDAQQSTILHCITISQLNSKVEELKKRYLEKGLTFQPIIIVIGDNLTSLTNFYTFYDGIVYKFPTFLKSLDITFKLMQVMNFEYPIEGKNSPNVF